MEARGRVITQGSTTFPAWGRSSLLSRVIQLGGQQVDLVWLVVGV